MAGDQQSGLAAGLLQGQRGRPGYQFGTHDDRLVAYRLVFEVHQLL